MAIALRTGLPSRTEMLRAVQRRDTSYEGVFVLGVRTTGVFCRPGCPARVPNPENIEFFPAPRDALLSGFRPCRRCRPLEPRDVAPDWLRSLLREVDQDPTRRWRQRDLVERGLSPERVRRWFQKHHDMTFQGYLRARRLGMALGSISTGTSVSAAALEHGWDSLSGFNEAFRNLFGAPPTAADPASAVVVTRIHTPVGPMLLGATAQRLAMLEFVDRRMLETQLSRLRKRLDCVMIPGTNAVIEQAEQELAEYFAGRRRQFTVPLELAGTDFQVEVWQRLLEIPWGTTVSYGELARRMGRPGSMRAVARANGDNRIAIMIPCHRVIGADGTLTGYGGGLWRKQKLLELEGAILL